MNISFSTKRFTHDAEKKVFITEASDLDSYFSFERIYPDSYDVGLELVSHKTGLSSIWYVYNTQYSNYSNYEARELQAWHLKPTLETLKQIPNLKGYTMVIFND